MLLILVLCTACLAAAADTYTAAERRHWAFQQRTEPAVPASTAWMKNPIDAFVLARMKKDGARPKPPASRRALIRRVYFDMIGLPPSPAEVDAFLADRSPDAWEKLVDRLLASPHYGERWAQHWLDVVRFAESDGFEYDTHRPEAWRFRDYVIRSLNADKPYDRFLVEQLAGDEIAPDEEDTRIAAGFQRLGPLRKNAGNQEVASSRNEVLTEMTNAVGSALLGVTLGCARCHDHKFDPIRQKDYYRIQAYFAATHEKDAALAYSVTNDFAKATPIHMLSRGDHTLKGERVGMRPLGVLLEDGAPELPAGTKQPRAELARWITDPKNPLTARVLVNRLWHYHFGAGIVATPNDFGRMGARPTNPELLDWLANRFVENGWRLKPVHRMILLSNAYQQRRRPRRLEAEQIRDAALEISGRLNRKTGGPSVIVPVDKELVNLLYKPAQWAISKDPAEHDRRSVYLMYKRNLRLPFMEAFDAPDLQISCARRESSTHAPQALEMLNGSFANDLAAALAARLDREARTPAGQAGLAYRLAAGRAPSPRESKVAVEFLRTQPLREFALAVLNLNAFFHVE
ncbi:MAG: DUF1549 and DUF1553 domain-containing protein [Bryobacteraceae bacterium]